VRDSATLYTFNRVRTSVPSLDTILPVRITANQVTLLRLVLLPLPVALVYRESRGFMLAALGVYILLGLTDVLDGYLARKHGSTALGALLDPVVDKIFLVAGFVPLADFQIMPTTLVFILFIRELGVTALRSIALEEGFSFKTSSIAKLKTTIQMAGAGFILLIWLFPADATIRAILLVAFAGFAVPAIAAAARGRRPGWMAWSSAACGATILAIRWVLPQQPAIFALMSGIVAITLYSGAEYAWEMRGVLRARFVRSPIEAVRLLGLSLAVPVFYLPALDRQDDPTFAILGLLAAEFAEGGLDNSLVQMGYARSSGPDLIRSGIQAGCGAIVLWALLSGAAPRIALAATLFALGVTLGDLGRRAFRHREDFESAAAVTRPIP
jgi:CDP-diacylglycerol--glycerol-3-phosphate 3-phosphatidyltransferase